MITVKTCRNPFLEGAGREKQADHRPGQPIAAYLPESWSLEDTYCIWNGKGVYKEALQAIEPRDGDELIFVSTFGDPVSALYVLANALYVAAPYLATIAISTAVSYGVSLLIGMPEPPDLEDDGSVFSPPRNRRRRGAPIPVIYGEHPVGGNILSLYTTLNERGDTFLNVLLAVSQGRIEGIGSRTDAFDAVAHDDPDLQDIKLNGNPLSSYSGVDVSFRPGEIVQSVIPGFNQTHDLHAIGSELDQPMDANGKGIAGPGPWFSYSTTKAVDAAVINISHSRGLYYQNGQGKIRSTPVFYEVRYRLSDAGGGSPGPWNYVVYGMPAIPGVQFTAQGSQYTTSLDPNDARAIMVEAKRTAPFASAFRLTFPTRDSYDIDVRRRNRNTANTADSDKHRHEPTKRNNLIQLGSIDEILDEALSYPGVALLALRNIDVKQTNGGLPTIVAKVKGVRVPVWDGVDADNPVYAYEWSNNPAWIALDVLTNKRYSVGNYLSATDPDLESLKDWADYCDSLVDDGQGGTEPLGRWDGVIFQEKEAWETLRQICLTARCAPILSGRKIKFKAEKARPRTQQFGMGNIVTDSWEHQYLGAEEDSPNQVIVQYLNADKDYTEDAAIFELDEVKDNSEPLRSKTVPLPGVTRPGQAMREAKLIALLGRRTVEAAGFRCGLDALAAEAGDRIVLAEDYTEWGMTGRVAAGSSSTTVVLDRSVTLDTGKTYEFEIQFDTGDRETRTVTSPAGTYPAGTAISVATAWSRLPQKHDLFLLGEQGQDKLDWIIYRIGRRADLTHAIKCVNYDESIYTDSLVIGQVIEANQNASVPQSTLIPPDVTGLTLRADPQVARDGTEIHALRASWAPASAAGARRYEVFYRQQGDTAWISAGETLDDELLLSSDISPGDAYEVAVVGVAEAGDKGHPESSPQSSATYDPVAERPVRPVNLSYTRVENTLVLAWDDPGNDADGQPLNRNLAFYRVKRGWDWRTAAFVGEVKGTQLETSNWTPGGELFLVKAVDTQGRESYTAASVWVDMDLTYGAPSFSYSERDSGWVGSKVNTVKDSQGRLAKTGAFAGLYASVLHDLGQERDWQLSVSGGATRNASAFTSQASRFVIGAVTGGPFTAGETVTGGTSGATATVLVAASDGDYAIYVKPVSGTFQANETVTGGTSSASCTIKTAALAVLGDDLEAGRWDATGRGDFDNLSYSLVLTALNDDQETVGSYQGFSQGVVRARYLRVDLSLDESGDSALGTPVIPDLRLAAWTPATN